MSSSQPIVSIGMPVLNGEKYIRDALDLLLAQTFTDFELIISTMHLPTGRNKSAVNMQRTTREFVMSDNP